MTTPGSHRRTMLTAPQARAAAVIAVMFAIAVVACAKLSPPSLPSPGPTSSPLPLTLPSPSAPQVMAASPSAAPPRYVFPVSSLDAAYIRTHAEYPASDILARCGTPVVAAADGIVLEVNRVDRWNATTDDGAWRGGRFLSILGDDGVRYYGAHFSVINAGLEVGTRVAAGQSVGQVGTTGKSGACHLHFGISPPCGRTGDWWNRRGVIWPWPYLDAWRAGTSISAVSEVSDWQAAHGCPAAP